MNDFQSRDNTFLTEDIFGSAVTITTGDNVVETNGILDVDHYEIDEDGNKISTNQSMLAVTESVFENITLDSVLRINNQNYKMIDNRRSNDGFVKLMLAKTV